jgi:hypothetical protein
MFRSFATAIILVSCLTAAGWAQSPATSSAPAAATPAKPVTKKAAPKAKATAKQPVAAETGPCTVRRIAYPKGAFEPYYNPKSRFLPDPNEGLPAIVRSITANANCERYLVITKYNGMVPGTKLEINGIGVYSQGIGSIARHSHLFANVAMSMYDGTTYEKISRSLAAFGASFAGGLGLTEDPLTKLDNSLFPDPPESASSSGTLKERTRALVSARLDRMIPGYLQQQ